ncbi:MAG TPA: acyl-CoA dehydrogenase family protein, partial [Myxococcota bacterium]|nr:acyl-CoA dehydrogenase family protein [Myxococcota bacterium]
EKVYRLAKDFATERVTMGKKIADHEMIAEYLDEMEVETKALRALAFNAGFHEEMSNRLKAQRAIAKTKNDEDAAKFDEKLKTHKWLARTATPLVKYMASENAVNFARRAMQIMGGVGYMKEYHAEKLMRDSLILPIYEGTSQIQALMVLKDHLQHAMRNPGKFVQKMATAKMQTLRARTPIERTLYRLESLYYSAMQTIMTRMVADKFGDLKDHPLAAWKEAFLKSWDPKKDFSFGLLHAERFCLIASRYFMAKVLIEQAERIENQELKDERLTLAMRFMERSEPRMRGLIHEIEASKSSIFRAGLLKRNEKKGEVAQQAVA